jgi:hypothetical protein
MQVNQSSTMYTIFDLYYHHHSSGEYGDYVGPPDSMGTIWIFAMINRGGNRSRRTIPIHFCTTKPLSLRYLQAAPIVVGFHADGPTRRLVRASMGRGMIRLHQSHITVDGRLKGSLV